MAQNDYTYLQLMRAMRAAGFQMNRGLITGFCVSCAENGRRDLTAVFVNSDPWHSRDRGPFMINDHWHSEVTDQCAFNLACAAQQVYRISQQGSDWTQWATFTSGAYRRNNDMAYIVYALDEALHDVDDAEAATVEYRARIESLTEQLANEIARANGLSDRLSGALQQVAQLEGQVGIERAAKEAAMTSLATVRAAAQSAHDTLEGVL
jgi:hypothetical protein